MSLYDSNKNLIAGTGNIAPIEAVIPSDASASNKLVAEDNKGVGKTIARNLSSAGWYKICESGSRNQGTGFQINLGSTYNNNASCMHMINFAYGYISGHMSELARDGEPIFDKIRFVYVSNLDRNIVLVHYRISKSNDCYATIHSSYNTNKLNVFNFETVDETQYSDYIEYNLGTNGVYENGQKLVTESDFNYKSGTVNFSCGADDWTTVNVTFDSPMPDTDYVVTLESGNTAYVHVQNVTTKSTNGFIIILWNRDSLSDGRGIINWQAYKIPH